ncbi:phosphotriesterase [Chloroflexota bacterium]
MTTTVEGVVHPEDLGIVAMCENMLYGLQGWENDLLVTFDRPKAYAAIASSLIEFKDAGGKTVVDSSGILLGRDAELLMDLASSAGINIIASTGFGSQDGIPGHFLLPPMKSEMRVPDADYLADMFYDELTEGMVVPGMRRTKIKAGIVKAASSWDQITEPEERSVRGAALAAKRGGVVLIITGSTNQVRPLLEIVLQEGLEADRIVVGHCDDGRAVNLERDKEIAKKGTYVAYDHIGWEDSSVPYGMPDEQRVELVKAMVEAGFAKRIILSCSAIGHAIDVPQPKHSFDHLLRSFVPKLKKANVPSHVIDTILIENPKRILTSRTA